VRASEGDLSRFAVNDAAGKRKRPPLLDVAAICSWQPLPPAASPPGARRISATSPGEHALPPLPERFVKRARRPGMTVRCPRRGHRRESTLVGS
jgi:hypothetical protein